MATLSKGIRRDAFVKGVRPDPKSAEELVVVQGYIGDSDLPGHVRVYSDAALSDYIDLPEQEVLYYDSVKHEEDPLGGSRLWVRKTTVFTTGDPRHANRVKSSFLEGDIVRAFGNTGKIPTVAGGNIVQFSGGITVCPPKSCGSPCRSLNPREWCGPSVNGPCYYANENAAGIDPAQLRPCVLRTIGCVGGTIGCIGGTIGCVGGTIGCNFGTQGCGFLTKPCIGGTIGCIGGTIGCFRGTIGCIQGTIGCIGGTVQCGLGSFYHTVQTDAVVNPAAQQQTAQAYTGGFDPYQTANYGY